MERRQLRHNCTENHTIVYPGKKVKRCIILHKHSFEQQPLHATPSNKCGYTKHTEHTEQREKYCSYSKCLTNNNRKKQRRDISFSNGLIRSSLLNIFMVNLCNLLCVWIDILSENTHGKVFSLHIIPSTEHKCLVNYISVLGNWSQTLWLYSVSKRFFSLLEFLTVLWHYFSFQNDLG